MKSNTIAYLEPRQNAELNFYLTCYGRRDTESFNNTPKQNSLAVAPVRKTSETFTG